MNTAAAGALNGVGAAATVRQIAQLSVAERGRIYNENPYIATVLATRRHSLPWPTGTPNAPPDS
jgi:hypothetical protein